MQIRSYVFRNIVKVLVAAIVLVSNIGVLNEIRNNWISVLETKSGSTSSNLFFFVIVYEIR